MLQAYAWLVTLVPSSLVLGPLGAFGTPANFVGLACFGTWAYQATRPGTLPRTVVPVRVAVGVVWVTGLVSYGVMHLNAIAGDEANSADRWMLSLTVWTGVALLAAESLRDGAELLRLLRVVIAGVAVAGTVAIVQYRTGFDATLWIAKLPLKANQDLQAVLERAGKRRTAGTATHPLELGTALTMMLGPALALATRDLGWPRRRRFLAVGLIGMAIPITISRSATVSTVLVLVVWFAGTDRTTRIRGSIAAALFAVVVFVSSPGLFKVLRETFESIGTDSSVSMRTVDYAAVASYLRRSPWIGRGPATFLPKYRILDNQWLDTLIETGLLGALALAIYFLAAGYLGLQARRAHRSPLTRELGQSFIATSAVAVWAATTFDMFAFPMSTATIALCLGVAGALRSVGTDDASDTAVDSDVPVDSDSNSDSDVPVDSDSDDARASATGPPRAALSAAGAGPPP